MSLEQSLVAVMLGESKDQTVGAGVLVDDNLIVTCAHVVNEALGRSQDQTGRPEPDAVIQVRFHSALAAGNQAAKVTDDWTDPPTWRAPGADVCVLRLVQAPPAGVGPASLRAFTSPAGLQFRAGGYPDNWEFDIARGAVAGVDGTGLWVLRPDPALFAAVAMSKPAGGPFARRVERPAGLIHAGFSGGPLEIKDSIAGIIAVAREKITDATSYMIPVAAFPLSLSPLVQSYANPIAERYPHVQGLAARLDKMAENKRIDKASPFDIRLRLCDDFSQVLEAHRAEPADPLGGALAGSSSEYVEKRDLRPRELARSLKRGRDYKNSLLSVILINAPGGAGKTSFLFELLRVAADEGLVPFYLDFSRNAPEAVAGENVKLPVTRAYLENWFGTFSGEGPVDLLLQLARGGSDKPLLIIDGFNQSKRNWQNELERIGIMAGQELAGAAIIVADRMIHRGELGSVRLAVIPPLSQSALAACLPESASRVVASDPAWLSILSAPLFLNIFRDIDRQVPTAVGKSAAKAIPSRFSVISNYFMDVCKFTKKEMSVLSAAAFRAYEAFGQTAIPRAQFESILKDEAAALAPAPGQRDVLAQIEHLGLIHDIGDTDIEFRHQIIHDYLASMRVASAQEDEDEVLLRAPAFDTLSLDSASSDAIELAVEALNEPGRLPSTRREPLSVRAFLTEVYDWNYWISLQCVTSFDRRCLAEPPIPEWMRHAVYTLNLEKQFDPFLHTAARAGELKSLIVRSAAVSYASARNPDELVEQVGEVFRELDDPAAPPAAGIKGPGMLWRDLYIRRKPFTRDDLDVLWRDPLFSWTAANVIGRLSPDAALAKELIRLYQISQSTSDSSPRAAGFRWRIVHALGCAPLEDVGDVLAGAAFNPRETRHVRYGAIRSLIQSAAASADAGKLAPVLNRVKEQLHTIFPQFDVKSIKPDDSQQKVLDMLANVRLELRRTCAINEPYFRGREGWLAPWLSSGLDMYMSILRRGESLSAECGLKQEPKIWSTWIHAVTKAKAATDWNGRRDAWLQAIKADDGT